MQEQTGRRRFPIGAELQSGQAHLRVWAPRCHHVAVLIDGSARADVALRAEGNGYFSGSVSGLGVGGRYRFRLDEEEKLHPDPASRFQPEGPGGPSEVIEPRAFAWADRDWPGVSPRGQVIYELHVGTFTAEGTYAAAAERLESLSELGVTIIELMPLADTPGRFGWGYDGVNLWAPNRLYGRPDDLRRFVAAAHALGVGVILDVVYNHIGPNENHLGCFSSGYFTDRYQNEWGGAINFDGDNAAPSREFFIENAGYWIDEFHFDGLRLDATQAMFDASDDHILAAIGRRVRAAARGRGTFIVSENEPQETRLVRPPEGPSNERGYGLDALWNDDFHHTALVALTGHSEAYYTDYRGTPQELLSAIRWGFLYQGQHYKWQKQRRGTPALDLPAERFVLYLENHDQVANSGLGARLSTITAPDQLRAMTALLLLAPGTPMLFQGQEFGSTRPFVYFADHDAELARAVAKGRRAFLAQFPSLADPDVQQRIPDPAAPQTFTSCKLDWNERDRHRPVWDLHRDLLRLRREDPAFAAQDLTRLSTAVLGAEAMLLRYRCASGDRLVLVNLGTDLHLDVAPEPLLAPPLGARWRTLWSSEDPRYGGRGTAAVEVDDGFHLPGHATVVLAPAVRP
ncbi:MAG TPA: malto-oligosyltrehalose trehalohydrolase [Polyangia bacterium]|nr:malto-oligosyltrehalose trehalohydrolase [Polyangia bacterium]